MANEVLAVATWSQVYGRLKTLKGDSNSNSDRLIEKSRGSRKNRRKNRLLQVFVVEVVRLKPTCQEILARKSEMGL